MISQGNREVYDIIADIACATSYDMKNHYNMQYMISQAPKQTTCFIDDFQ
jgi:hypothetical protein